MSVCVCVCVCLCVCVSLEFRMTRLLDEFADQVAFTWGLAMDADELRLVWTNMRGAAMTIDH